MSKNYKNAIALLDSRRRKFRPSLEVVSRLTDASTSNRIPETNGIPSLKGLPNSAGMQEWLQLLGYANSDLNNLNVIHIAGTKGKGSTCAFIDSFLQSHKERTGFPQKIARYTSPHLKCVEERLRINSTPISRELFSRYVFEVWDKVSIQGSQSPGYLQFLMLLSVHVFINEGVDVAIYETHHGGEFDATNIFPTPVVTGITTIGMDHIQQLGPSLEQIAWHKAGIFKPGCYAISTTQEPTARAELQKRANTGSVPLQFVDLHPKLPTNSTTLNPKTQRLNCSLALAITQRFLEKRAPQQHTNLTSADIAQGVKNFSLQGRFQNIVEGNNQWFLDGAHNELSIPEAAHWFIQITIEKRRSVMPPTPILIFSHCSTRDGSALVKSLAILLHNSEVRPQHIIFSTYRKTDDDMNAEGVENLDLQKEYAAVWRGINPAADISIERTIDRALNRARSVGLKGNGMQTLITGSLYLVGGALCLLEPIPSEGT